MIDKAPDVRHHCGTIVSEALRAAVGLAGMDVDTMVVLVNDAVLTVLGEQNKGTGMKDLDKFLRDAEEFGLRICVHLESAETKGIHRDQFAGIGTVDAQQLTRLVHEVDATITF